MFIKLISLCISIIIITNIFNLVPSYGQEINIADSVNEVNGMSNEKFDDWLMEYVSKNKGKKTFVEMKSELNSIGIQFNIHTLQNEGISLMSLAKSDITLQSYAAKRTGDSFYRVYGCATFNKHETSPSGYDLISVEWDNSKTTYYSKNMSKNVTTMDGSKRSQGIYLFDVDDSKTYAGDYEYAVVYVNKKSSASSVDIGTKYTHTYGSTSYNWSLGVNFNYSSSGPSGGASYSVTGISGVSTWSKYEDNVFN